MKNFLLLAGAVCFLLEGGTGLSISAERDQTTDAQNSEKQAFKWIVPNEPLEKTLLVLAKKQQLDPNDFFCFGVGSPRDESYIKRVSAGKSDYAVIVQDIRASGVPGDSTHQIVLLTIDGKILDRIQCVINAASGHMETSIFSKAEPDGAQIVIRVGERKLPNGEPIFGHDWHRITFHGKSWRFHSSFQKDTWNKKGIWYEKGLCRIGIADDKFEVVFPKLEMPDLSKAKSLKITFSQPNENEKTLVVSDAKEVAEICKLISLKSAYVWDTEGIDWTKRTRRTLETMVDFVMSDGKTIQMGFGFKTSLVDTLTGDSLDLDSDSFYQALTKIVSKAEGHQIELGLSADTGGAGNAKKK